MTLLKRISLVIGMIVCTGAWGAPSGQDPYVGYVYPAGGRQGTVFRVTLGGQRLRGASGIHISGSGVRASVIGYVGASGPLSPAQQDELKRRLEEIRDKRIGTQRGAGAGQAKPGTAVSGPDGKAAAPIEAPRIALPDLPELRDLESQTARQLKQVVDKFLNRAKRPKQPIAEQVTLEITIDSDAAPGNRELRLRTPAGLTNPLVFQVGRIPEISESEDAAPEPAQPPVALNGRIMQGDVDRFPLQLSAGQKLVIVAQARSLIPYLADAVPGWFQAVMALHDPDGKEIAYVDDCGFDPDPILSYQAPRDGKYTLEIRDAIYRGRQDFVYRVGVVDESDVRSVVPSGMRGGVRVGASQSPPQTPPQSECAFAGDSLPACAETEPNDTVKGATRITLPHTVSGCVSSPSDTDVFRFSGKAGQDVVAEVWARRMGSPLDSLLRLTDASGRIVAWNDDHEDKESGLLTHHADSYLSARLPSTGDYFLRLSDAQRHGGSEYRYRLRVGPPQPDFALRLTPSSLNVAAGRAVSATVYALRKDGWDGDIDVTLKDAPAGFSLSGARIPRGRDHVRMTLTAPIGRAGRSSVLHMEGSAQIGGKAVTRPVIPADDMMQAFAYRHLVPSDQLLLTVTRAGIYSPRLEMGDGDRLSIPSGGSVQVRFSTISTMRNSEVSLELNEPPAGVTLGDVKVAPNGFILTLKADDKHIGYADNLIVEAFTEIDPTQGKGGKSQKQRVPLGPLPAIPFEIVKP